MSIEIYIGSLIEHGSERATLERMVACLSRTNTSAIILANVNFNGRQLDLVVGLQNLTLVIEAKGYSVPVRGGENGPWQVRVASGSWKSIPNPHIQTVGARHALRDAMSHHSGAQVSYPCAALVFTPSIPPDSSLFEGNFKARIVGLEAVDGLLAQSGGPQWTLDRWRSFAHAHRLTLVANVQAASDAKIAAAEELIAAYTAAFRRTYAPLTEELIPLACRSANDPCSSDEVIKRGAAGANLLLRGPSGCGKTLLGYRIGVDSIDQGQVPIFVRAKDFGGNLRDVVNQEAALLDAPSAQSLLSACHRLGRGIILIVDGYNECVEGLRAKLTRSMAAVSRRYIANVVVTCQSPLEQSTLLELDEIGVPVPDPETKNAIARQASAGTLDIALLPLLHSVASGLEARLIGEIGRELSVDASRYALFDRYVRKRLGSQASDGIRALARIAGLLLDRISFGLSVRDLDRFAEQESLASGLMLRLHEAGLLASRGERASFGHELFLDAFAAEAVIRRAQGDAARITASLLVPQHADRKPLILGAIDDTGLLHKVLEEITDPDIILSCLAGHCGGIARAWASRRCDEIMRYVGKEIAQVKFEIGGGFMGVKSSSHTLLPWTRQDKAVLAALPYMVGEGRYLDEALELVAALDKRLPEEHRRLLDQAREQQVALRSGLFANCYVWAGSESPAVARICSPIHSGLLLRNTAADQAFLVRERLGRNDLTDGQLYLLLALYRRVGHDRPSLAPLLPSILRRHWRGAAYHLRLDLMDTSRSAGWGATDAERRAVIEAIEEFPETNNVGISTIIVDALKGLGALDDSESEYVEVVRRNFRDLSADQDNPDMQALAFSVWYGQFDHPYDGAYCQVVSELAPAEKKLLLEMAARGADQESSFVGILILELAGFGDPGVSPLIARWTAPPPTRSIMPQDAIGRFAVAHIALGRLGRPLPEADAPAATDATTDAAKALIACGHILYWLNRIDLAMPRRRAACAGALTALMCHERGLAVSVINEFYWSNTMWTEGIERLPGEEPVHTSLAAFFPEEIAEACRRCLLGPEPQRGYFDHPDGTRVLTFAIDALAQWGNPADIPLLRQLSADARLGRSALGAIAKLESAGA